MKAIRVHQFGDPTVMKLEEIPDTSPDAGAPPSLFHRLMAMAFISASVGGFFALLLMPRNMARLPDPFHARQDGSNFKRPHYRLSTGPAAFT